MKRSKLISASLLSALALALFSFGLAACKKSGGALKLEAADGGSVSVRSVKAAEGSSVAEALEGVTVTAEEGLEFAGWYEGTSPLAPDRVMPAGGLTLTAKFNATYSLSLYLRGENGYPAQPEQRSGKALYHEPFTYAHEHGDLEATEGDRVSSPSLQKDESFTAHVIPHTFLVRFDSNLPAHSHLAVSYSSRRTAYYDVAFPLPSITVTGSGSVPYRFAGWASEPDGSAEYGAGENVKPDGETTFYAVWERGYADFFGGSDVLYPVKGENAVELERAELGLKRGEYDPATGTFSFEEDGKTVLSGKLTEEFFYYYRDTLERTYNDYGGSGDTLELLAAGAAKYTEAGGNEISGTYEIDAFNGLFLFRSGGKEFYFDLWERERELTFRLQGSEAGYYEPEAQAKRYGVVRYYLDGFGGGRELYGENTPFLAADGSSYLSLYLDYYEIDSGDGFVTYRATSYTEEEEQGRVFDFRVRKNAGGDGAMQEGDFLTGHYPDADGGEKELYLDGFGKGTFGDDAIVYELDEKHWYTYNSLSQLSAFYDLTVTFTAGGKDYRVRTRSLFYGQGSGYEIVGEGLFGEYLFEDGIPVNGESAKALVYFYRGFSEMMNGDNCVILLVETGTLNGESVWELADTHDGDVLEPDENGVYRLDGGTLFTVDGNARTARYVEATTEGEEIVFLDGDEKLSVDAEGVATYTPAGGTAITVEYTVDSALGSPAVLAAVYTFRIGGKDRTFACYLDSGTIKAAEADALYEESTEYGDRILLFTVNGKEIADVGVLLLGGEYYYGFEGALEQDILDGENEYTFVCGESTFNSYLASLLGYDKGFDFRVDGTSFTRRVSSAFDYTKNADTLSLDGYGTATLVSGGKETEYGYDVALFCTFENLDGEPVQVAVLYRLTDANGELVRFFVLDEEENTFDYPDENLMMIVPFDDGVDQIFLDGCGNAYLSTFAGVDNTEVTSALLYKKIAGREDGRDEFALFDEEEDEPSYTVLIVSSYTDTEVGIKTAFYAKKDAAQAGEFEVVGGGTLYGSGYGMYGGSIVDFATFTDAYGVVHSGVLEIGNLDDKTYNARNFTKTAAGTQIRFTEGEKQIWDGYEVFAELNVFIFDRNAEDKAELRTEYFGAYRKYEKGKPTSAYLYLDGHGNATLYDEDGKEMGDGAVEYDEVANAYRYRSGNTAFLFNLYSMETGSGTSYFYSEYAPEEEATLLCADWSILKFDGYVSGVYVSRYGDVVRGTYGFITDWLAVLYPFDGSARRYFKITGKNTFETPNPSDGFLVENGILYAYTLDPSGELTLRNDILEIYDGVFANMTGLTSVDLNNVTKIGKEAFAFPPSNHNGGRTSDLERISSEKVTEIGDRAFSWTTSLKEANFPKAEKVGDGAFWNSNATAITLGNLKSVGDCAFARSKYSDEMTLDLSALADVSAVTWGKNLFTAVDGDELTDGVIPVNILVGSAEALARLYSVPAFAEVRDRIGLKGETARGQYFDLATGNILLLSGGLLSTAKVGTFGDIVADKTLGLVSVEGEKITLFAEKADGSGYETEGTEIGDEGFVTVEETVYIAVGKDLSLTADSGEEVTLNFSFANSYELFTYTVVMTVNGEAAEASYKKEENEDEDRFVLSCTANGTKYIVTVTEAGKCTLASQGGNITVETVDRQFRVTFEDNGDGLTIVKFESYRSYGEGSWENYFIKAEAKGENTFLVYNNEGASKEKPFLYTVVYHPESKSVTVEFFGKVTSRTSDDYMTEVFFILDNNSEIVGVMKVYYRWTDYYVTSFAENGDGVYTVVAESEDDGTNVTFTITVTEAIDESGGEFTIEEV